MILTFQKSGRHNFRCSQASILCRSELFLLQMYNIHYISLHCKLFSDWFKSENSQKSRHRIFEKNPIFLRKMSFGEKSYCSLIDLNLGIPGYIIALGKYTTYTMSHTGKNVEKFCFSPKFFVFLRSLYCHFEKNPIFFEKKTRFLSHDFSQYVRYIQIVLLF